MKFNINKKVRKSRDGKIIKTELWYSYTHNGKRVRKPLGLNDTKANRKLVENEIFPDLLVKLKNDELFKNAKEVPTIDEFILHSFKLHKSERNRQTHDDYIGIYKNHIKDFFKNRRIDDIKPSHIQLWQNNILDKGISPARIRTMRTVLTTMYNDAIKDEIVDKNPLSVVRTPKISQTIINPFTLSEIELILSNAKGQFKNFYATAFFTGMRSGELIGLRWSDVDFTNGEISVSRRIKMGDIGSPKTVNSIRTVEILDTLIPYLQEQYKLTGHLNSYIFLNKDNEHFYDIKRIRDTHWKRDLKAVGLDYRPIYHTRHSFATLMLSNNEDILWVSSMLGHKDSTMTLSVYAKYIKRDKKKRGQFLDTEMFQSGTKLSPNILQSA